MYNEIKRLLNSAVSEYSMMVIVFCLMGNAILSAYSKEWTSLADVFTVIGGIVLVAWVIWGSYVLISKKRLAIMSQRKRIISETVSYVLSLIWIYVVSESLLIAMPWALLFGWNVYQTIKEYKGTMSSNGE